MALQVTLFPNTGICIGISLLHVIADGKTATHFMKSWASVCKSGLGDTSCLLPELLPFHDRSAINDPNNLETIYLKVLATLGLSQQCFYKPREHTIEIDKVRATFVMSRHDTENLRRWVLDQVHETYNKSAPPTLHLSPFVLTYAYFWVCLTKVLASEYVGMETEYLIFPVDCRERLNPPIPTTYFGKCLMTCFVEVKRNDLIGENGIAIAAKAIGDAILQKLNGVFNGEDKFFTKIKFVLTRQRFLSIAGSPKLPFYAADFGWGRPKKFEVVSIANNGAISLSECREGDGGVEVGLVLNKPQMEEFAHLFSNSLQQLSSLHIKAHY